MRHALLAEIASKRRVAIDEAQQQRVEYFGRTLVLQEDRLGGVAGSVWDCVRRRLPLGGAASRC